jgi:hypothetical protein
MKRDIKNNSKKQLDLRKWVKDGENIAENNLSYEIDKGVKNKESFKPKLAFGYGFDPETLKKGITKYTLSHSIDKNKRLYEFQPKISYRIFSALADIIHYKFVGSELRKGNTIIKNSYFITDQDPEKVVDLLNTGIFRLFEKYDPHAKYEI